MTIGITVSPYCCGIAMMGNFNYLKERGPKGLAHYHRPAVGSGWTVVGKGEPTTEKEIRDMVEHIKMSYGAIIATTGADQEYVDEILPRLGFTRQKFTNKIHEQGTVNIWILNTSEYTPAPKETKEKKTKEKA
jgi:hypothetical protein